MKIMAKKQEAFMDWVVYQIYPKSFNDSNNDGIGDIPGIIEKLDYLKDLGINAIWLCPCYKSPCYDNGYDISDYRTVAEEFGTQEDIKRLISEMHSRDMKLIMDLVPNHTSSEHEWFVASREGDEKYRNYYYWFDEPQNDWKSCFGGSAWEFDEKRGQYYLHSYCVQQPDLNWNEPCVVKEMCDVVDYWIDLGVDGFRCDVIDQISKDFEGNRNCFGPHLHEYINALFGREKAENIFTVGECWANDIDEIERHIAPERGELSTLFQFDHVDVGRSDKFTPKDDSLASLRDILVKWQVKMQERGLLYSLLTDNHDQNYYVSRVGDDGALRYESASCIAAMVYLLRGIPFIYQGQEIGSAASHFDTIDKFNDVETVNAYREFIEKGLSEREAMEKINFGSRDNTRRPFAWDGSEYGGFSEHLPWLPMASRAAEINLESDLAAGQRSVFRFYRNTLRLRRENPAFRKGTFREISSREDDFFVYEREYEDARFVVVCNFKNAQNIDRIPRGGSIVLSNYADRTSVDGEFRPYETVVLRY